VTKLLYLSNSGLPDWSVVCVSWLGFNYITLTASSDAADAIQDAFGMRVNCLWTVTAWPVFISNGATEADEPRRHLPDTTPAAVYTLHPNLITHRYSIVPPPSNVWLYKAVLYFLLPKSTLTKCMALDFKAYLWNYATL